MSSKGFDAWFEKALARNPDDRFQSAQELAESFARLCSERSSIESGDTLLDLGSRGAGAVPVESASSTLANGTVTKPGTAAASSRRTSVGLALMLAALGILVVVVTRSGDASRSPGAQREEPVSESRILGMAPRPSPSTSSSTSAMNADAGTQAVPVSRQALPAPKPKGVEAQRPPAQPKRVKAAHPSTPPQTADQIEVLRRKR
jgi:eukaryotic-like serine/threonine-protein kinase